MTALREPKKSETLEIRLPYATKQAFMERCREQGRSASEALRSFIAVELEPPRVRRRGPRRFAVAGLAAIALAAVAAPSLARPACATRFDALDTNHDGFVSAAELLRLDTDRDGRVSRAEFMRAGAGSGRP